MEAWTEKEKRIYERGGCPNCWAPFCHRDTDEKHGNGEYEIVVRSHRTGRILRRFTCSNGCQCKECEEFWRREEERSKPQANRRNPYMKPMPAGECYRNVIQYMKTRVVGVESSAKIVHGSILSLTTGRRKRILHAWIEHEGDVIDPTQGVTINCKDYYRLVGAKVDARYTFEQALILSLRNRNWGPWT